MAKPQPVNIGDASPKRLLVTWANEQDAWVRHLVAETLLTRKPADGSFIEQLYSVFLAEKGLSKEPQPEIPFLELDDREEAAEETLELIRIQEIKGVNALALNQVLDFDPSLTILYGQNGSGKTGYARIIKRAAAVRTAEPILPNVNIEGEQEEPSASISYTLDTEPTEVRWNNEAGLSPLTRISVFDSTAVTLHVDTDLGYVYTPAELALFGQVSVGIQKLQEKITEEARALRPKSNVLLSRFVRGTTVYPVIESLGAATELAELAALAEVPDDATEQKDRLEQEVAALRANTAEALLTHAESQVRGMTRLEELAQVVSRFSPKAYNLALDNLSVAQTARRKARGELFDADELPGPPDDDWQKFITAGDEYQTHLGLHDYPQSGNQCLYCRQPLAESALDLVRRYRTFLDESYTRRVTDSRRQVDEMAIFVDPGVVVQCREFIETQTGEKDPSSWIGVSEILLDELSAELVEVNARRKSVAPEMTKRSHSLTSILGPLISVTKEQVRQLAQQKHDRAETLAAKERNLRELSARIELRSNLETARVYVQNAKRGEQLDNLSKSISNKIARSLTDQSKLASEDLVNKNFEQLFREECEVLRAPLVALQFQARSGRAERRKFVASHKPSQILSEGEQKVLALADFLAESRMRGVKAPVVFDDPITSLDYRRLEEVSRRIHELSETHQVVLFTHNIMFASTLIALRQSKGRRCKYYEVRDGEPEKGILAPDVEPRFDQPSDIAKRINKHIALCATAEPAVQDALIAQSYDLIRSWCEAFVEQELLKNVTQRYRANIMMTRLDAVRVDLFASTASVITPLFDKACRNMTGHSQGLETLNTKPTLAELKDDWSKAQAARTAYIS
ncbi:Wobble nucleotide-excising tRNase [Actinokineospora alba]|uniref:Wobble nucleotide-excising tRNase n=1 Tax=Actinokineospora alba TaxID=504798 RepID=A0A1H0JST3_9PSEU|nr:hypothetical protein [Actinokineospora alba]TDP68180.1 wobble nucleotide-excising tRNase [Actinokineospora alba]SDH93748.1 Wobble nucleotide-excising tRNase [Actinokineospora alba]SDO46684.1 Wobble nucleotide-excising tRNase [Actinokineospora alba]